MTIFHRQPALLALLCGMVVATTCFTSEQPLKSTTVDVNGVSIYYEIWGDTSKPPVLLITGLGGMGASWHSQIQRFAEKYCVILPDQRGTGRSSRTLEGYTTEQLAEDMAALVDHSGLGPVHVVGSSTGGAIGQYIALNHPDKVRSLTLSSTFARFDEYTHREFKVRRKMSAEWSDRVAVYDAIALFVFSPRFTHDNPDFVEDWIRRATSHPPRPEDYDITLKRIDMIINHDALSRLGDIDAPTLVMCGELNTCTPMPLSEELARTIPGAELVVIKNAGELIEIEKADEFFAIADAFITRHHK